jgi:hypothetical protein
MLHFVAERFKHAANLTIDSLTKNYAQSRRRTHAQLFDLRPLTIKHNSAQQFWSEVCIPGPIQSDLIFLVDLVTGMGELLRQIAVVGEKEQTLGLSVKPADIEEFRKLRGQEIKNHIPRVRIFSSRNEAGGLVQSDGERRFDADKAAIHFDVILRGGLRAEISADLSVDGDAPGGDEFVTGAPGTNPGGGEITVQPHG